MSLDKVNGCFAVLVGFVVGFAFIHAVGQPTAMQSPINMAVQYKPTQPKFLQQMKPIAARASTVVAKAEHEPGMGRREMLAGVLGLAVAGSNRAVAAQQDSSLDKVYGKPYVESALPPAGDYTAYNKVVTLPAKAKEVPQAGGSPGSVEVQPLLVPAVIGFSAFFTAAVPALLSPGQTAKDSQDANSKSGKIKGRVQRGKAKTTPPAKKGLFR